MDLYGGPAALSGIVMCAAMAGWALGRWQVGSDWPDGSGSVTVGGRSLRPQETPSTARADQRPVLPCEHAARKERQSVRIDATDSLGELHAEISAYRRAEQVLAGLDRRQLAQLQPSDESGSRCHYLGVAGQPTCAPSEAARRNCGSAGSAPERAQPAAQLSLAVADLTRV